MKRKKIVVLGAGLAGLTAAEKLAENFDVTILEKATFCGGLASSFKMEGAQIPKFYHHIVASNKHTIAALDRFGLMKEAEWKRVRIAICKDGRCYELKKPWQFFKIPGASLWAKLRFALFGSYVIFSKCPKIKSDVNAGDWLRKFCGKEATDFFWWNLYGRNKFNIPLEKISAAQFAQRLWEKEGYDLFTFPKKGLQPMVDGFEGACREKGVDLRLGVSIKEIDVKKKTVQLDDEKLKYDILVNTIPVPELLKIGKNLPEKYTQSLKKLRYCPAVGICFATKEFLLPGVYWLNLFGERIHVIMQHSVLIDKYNNKVSWLIRYGGAEEDFTKNDEELKELYLGVIKKYFPSVKLAWSIVFREKYAEPVYDKDYAKYAPKYISPIKDFFNAGIQVTFPKIRNQNVAIESGYKVAEIINKRYNN